MSLKHTVLGPLRPGVRCGIPPLLVTSSLAAALPAAHQTALCLCSWFLNLLCLFISMFRSAPYLVSLSRLRGSVPLLPSLRECALSLFRPKFTPNSVAVGLPSSLSAQHTVSPFPAEISNLLTLLSRRFSERLCSLLPSACSKGSSDSLAPLALSSVLPLLCFLCKVCVFAVYPVDHFTIGDD